MQLVRLWSRYLGGAGDDRLRVPGRARRRHPGRTRTRSAGCGSTCSHGCCGTSRWCRRRPLRTWPPRPGWGWSAAWTASRATSRRSGPGCSPSPGMRCWTGAAGWPAARPRRWPSNGLVERAAPDDPAAADRGGVLDPGGVGRWWRPCRPIRPRRWCCGWWPGWGWIGWRRSWASGPGTVRVLTHRGLRRLAERLGADARLQRGGVTRWPTATLGPLTCAEHPPLIVRPVGR